MKKDLIHFVRWEKVPEDQVEDVLSQLPQWGVKNIVAHPKWFRDGGESYVQKISLLLQKNKLLSTACHALWGRGNDCILPDRDQWPDMIRRHSIFLRDIQTLHVTTYTIHLGFNPDRNSEENFSFLKRSVDALLPVCEETGITLALENSQEPLQVLEKVSEMITAYKNKHLGMCFDCGHANSYQGSVRETLEVMRDNIVTCHLHDNYGEHDDHNPPGEGNINWRELDALLDTLPRLHHAETESGIWDEQSWKKFCAVLGKL